MKRKEISAIYTLITLHDGRRYIGGSRKALARGRQHLSLLKKNKHTVKEMQIAFDAYGERDFEFKILEVISSVEELVERERFWIKKLKVLDPRFGYNLYNGGTGIRDRRPNPALAKANKRRWKDPEYKARVSAAISLAKLGKSNGPHSSRTRAKIARANRARAYLQVGVPLSVETRAKMSASRLGKRHSEETRAKISASRLGKKRGAYKKKICVDG